MMYYRLISGGVALLGGGGASAGVLAASPTISINASQSPYTVPAGVAAVRNTGAVSSALTVILPSASVGSASDGQLFFYNNFDSTGQTNTLQAAAGDNIEGGTQHFLSQYASFCCLKARVASGVTNWTFFGINTRDTLVFPLQPALVANMAAVNIGGILIPGGVKSVRSAWLVCNSPLTAGQISATLTGLVSAQTLTISTTEAATGHLNTPGNNNWSTVPALAAPSTPAGCLVTGTMSTNAAFAGPTAAAVMLDTY